MAEESPWISKRRETAVVQAKNENIRKAQTVELGLFQDLDLADKDVLKSVDALQSMSE
jgi:hypothetical protein